tara:strand:- start:27 stop:479 length:453 start_codon:yes stop_codon:yes gene_type:complete
MTLVNTRGNFSGTIQGVSRSLAASPSGTILNIDWNHATIASQIKQGRISAQWDQNSSNNYIACATCVFHINYSAGTGLYYLSFMSIAANDSPGSLGVTSSIIPYWFNGTTETLGSTGVASTANYIRLKITQGLSLFAASPFCDAYLIREI